MDHFSHTYIFCKWNGLISIFFQKFQKCHYSRITTEIENIYGTWWINKLYNYFLMCSIHLYLPPQGVKKWNSKSSRRRKKNRIFFEKRKKLLLKKKQKTKNKKKQQKTKKKGKRERKEKRENTLFYPEKFCLTTFLSFKVLILAGI